MPAHVTPVIGIQSPGSPQSSSNRNGRTTVSSSVARSTTPASISSATGLQTTTLNGVVATQKSSGHASSRPPRIAQRVGMTENGGATDDAPVIGGLQDEDESLEHAAALASPLRFSGVNQGQFNTRFSICRSHKHCRLRVISRLRVMSRHVVKLRRQGEFIVLCGGDPCLSSPYATNENSVLMEAVRYLRRGTAGKDRADSSSDRIRSSAHDGQG